MADFCVTGKKGAGKTLSMIDLIKKHIDQGRPVATNLDLYLDKLTGPHDKTARVIRLPDMPTAEDLVIMGEGNPTPNEDNNGALILDEMAIWFNSRAFNDQLRKPFLDWLVLARKAGWDVYYLSQDISQVDKQLREGLAEHVVYCRRMDRLSVPFIGTLFKLVWGDRLKLPRYHVAMVRYGTAPNAPRSDLWTYRGDKYFKAYNTRQKFVKDCGFGPYSYLPAYWLTYKSFSKRCGAFYMRLTKIIGRKYSRVTAFSGGVLATCLLLLGTLFVFYDRPDQPLVTIDQVKNQKLTDDDLAFIKSLKVVSYSSLPGRAPVYKLKGKDGVLDTQQLIEMGFDVKPVNKNVLLVGKGLHHEKVFNM